MEQIIDYKNHSIEVIQDESSESPRYWSNLGKMVCFHGRYNLGDKHDYKVDDFSGWGEFQKHLENSGHIVLPLYLFDHSGITMATSPFSCRWDSGQVGFIVANRKEIRAEFGWLRISEARNSQICEYLKNEVATYDDYLRGNVYGYTVKNSEDIEIDACWGFYGDPEKSGLIDEAKSIVDNQ